MHSRHVFVEEVAEIHERLDKLEEVVFGPKRIEGNVYATVQV